MTKKGQPKTVAEVRDALARLEEERAGYLATLEEAEFGIKQSARLIFEGDSEAVDRRKGYKMRRNAARDALEQIEMFLPDLQAELTAAVAQEDQQAREADTKAAEVFAEGLPNVFRECDRTFAEFHRAFRAAIDAVNTARLRNWNVPTQELLQAKLVRALRTWLSVADLRMLDLPALPSPERCSFASLGEAYAQAIVGGARNAVKPVPPPRPTPTPAARSDDRKLPPRGDVGMRFRDDPKEFEIRIPTGRS
jgi:hypothetical protein